MLTRRYHPPARAVNANSLTREFAAVAAPAASGTPTNSTVPFGVYELEHAAAALPSIKLVSGREPDEWRVNAYGTRVARDGDERDTARASVVAEAKLAYGAPPSGLDCFFVATARSSLSLTPRAPRPLNIRLANHRHEATTHRPSASVPAKPCRNLVVPTREMSSAKGGDLNPKRRPKS